MNISCHIAYRLHCLSGGDGRVSYGLFYLVAKIGAIFERPILGSFCLIWILLGVVRLCFQINFLSTSIDEDNLKSFHS